MDLPPAHLGILLLGIYEPVRVWYDSTKNMSKTEYYNGLDTYLYRTDMGTAGLLFQVTLSPREAFLPCPENRPHAFVSL